VLDDIAIYDTTVLTQPVETEAVDSALAGDEFIDITTNYLGQETVAVARPLDVGTLQWVVVADIATQEAQAALVRFTRTLGLMALFLVPAVAIFAWLASRTLLRPIAPIAEASDRVTAGDLDVHLPSFGHDEYGDVATKFNRLVGTLREQEGELRAAEEETNELLAAVMPSQLVEQFLHGDRDIAEAVRDATLIALTIAGPRTVDPTEEEALADLVVETSAGVSRLAETHGAQLLSSSATQLLYATGLTSDDVGAGQAVDFTMAVRRWVGETARSGEIALEFRGGVAAGDVVAGVVGTDRVSFAVWGAPRRRAVELAAVAEAGQVLVGPSVAGSIGDSWVVEAVPERVDLEGETLDGWRIVGPR
jgi:HAMP domain-containing protein